MEWKQLDLARMGSTLLNECRISASNLDSTDNSTMESPLWTYCINNREEISDELFPLGFEGRRSSHGKTTPFSGAHTDYAISV
jgi:hypothetical protein